MYLGTDLNLIESHPNIHPFLNAYNQSLFYCNRRIYKVLYWKMLRYLNIGTENVISSGIGLMDSIVATLCESKKAKINKIKDINQKLKIQNKRSKLNKHSK